MAGMLPIATSRTRVNAERNTFFFMVEPFKGKFVLQIIPGGE
jgi:hypothetical protein